MFLHLGRSILQKHKKNDENSQSKETTYKNKIERDPHFVKIMGGCCSPQQMVT
jgi:hypothetical protein